MKPGQTVSVRGYDLTFDDLVSRPGPNYRELIAKFTVKSGTETIGETRALQAHLCRAQVLDHGSGTC